LRNFIRVILIIVVILLVLLSIFVIWANTPPSPMPLALEAINDDNDSISVDDTRWLVFTPENITPTTGFIFYPGGRVSVESYAPLLRDIAREGYLVVGVPMLLNLAFFSPERADEVIAAYPDIERWVIGGHSLGGAMAARYAYAHPDTMDGVVLWASFVEDAFSLADRNIGAASIYGTLDGLASVESVEANRAALPPDALFVAIEGGNHAQFGDYGDQAGDKPATITRAEQQAQTLEATLSILRGDDN
jgi:pimeloyl-ACP methyl ester carboxylesterase